MDDRKRSIGFVGLGQMGLPMSKHIINAGYEVVAWSRNSDERIAFENAGGTTVDNLAEVGKCSTVLSIVFDDEAVRTIVFGPNGLSHTLGAGACYIAMETISPSLAREVSDELATKGVHHISAPVFGPPHVAAAAELKFNCSGPLDTYQSVKTLLATMGTSYWFGSEPGQALMVKLMGNNMIFAIIELIYEAFSFLGASNIKDDDIKQMLIDRLFESPIISNYAKLFAENPGMKPPFNANPIPQKDNILCLKAAELLGVDLPLVRLVQEKMLPAS